MFFRGRSRRCPEQMQINSFAILGLCMIQYYSARTSRRCNHSFELIFHFFHVHILLKHNKMAILPVIFQLTVVRGWLLSVKQAGLFGVKFVLRLIWLLGLRMVIKLMPLATIWHSCFNVRTKPTFYVQHHPKTLNMLHIIKSDE